MFLYDSFLRVCFSYSTTYHFILSNAYTKIFVRLATVMILGDTVVAGKPYTHLCNHRSKTKKINLFFVLP